MIKRVDIIKSNRKGQFILYPINTMIGGGGIASEPYVFLDDSVDYKELAKGVLDSLKDSKMNVERPKNFNDFSKSHLKLVKFKTFKELHTDSINVGASIKDGVLMFTPTKNMGSRQGFQYSKSLSSVELPEDSSIEKIAEALEEALLRCEY